MTDSRAWLIVLASIAATYVWRALGVAVSAHIRADGQWFQWITCVSYAMLAGLIARMTVLPLGELEAVPLGVRLVAMGVAFVAFFATNRNVLFAVFAGVATLTTMAAAYN